MDETHIRLQYERLARHEAILAEKMDEIALLDLAASLRVWADMKRDVDAALQARGDER